MTKLIETLNSTIKLISSLATLAVLGGLVYGVLWTRAKVAELTAKPIQLPSVKLPDVQMPKITVEAPTIDMSGIFGGKKEPAPPAFGENWEVNGQPPFGPPPPPPSGNGCLHSPACTSKEQHLLAELSGGKTAGKWVEP